MDAALRGKKALVTGGASGIAQAIAFALGREGVDVAVVDVIPATETLRGLAEIGVAAHELRVDVSDEDQVVAMVADARVRLGGLDLFVNAAAVTRHEPVTRLTTEAWTSVLDTNLSACMWACREVARHFVRQRSGSILIVGSTVAHNAAYREASYRVSKTGLKPLMETLAIELAPFGVRVNMLTPGAFTTGLLAAVPDHIRARVRAEIPLRREGRVEELTAAAILLLSDPLSPYTTGADIVVDGGLHLRPLKMLSDDEVAALNAPDQT
jgi:NAD(P)-dependent dehydrogenase (short-subunit alcohol dehydrogenase family)